MAATPYTAIWTLQPMRNGQPISEPVVLRMAGSDVAGERLTFTDLAAEKNFSVPGDIDGIRVEDLTLSAAGVDTSTLQLTRGSAATTVYLDMALLATKTIEVESRIPSLIGKLLRPSVQYGFAQLA